MTEPVPWRCRCGYWLPTKSMRDQHALECPLMPKETK